MLLKLMRNKNSVCIVSFRYRTTHPHIISKHDKNDLMMDARGGVSRKESSATSASVRTPFSFRFTPGCCFLRGDFRPMESPLFFDTTPDDYDWSFGVAAG
ncbi:hypothetical protein CEXT_475371 [Caerostris extrusa]|uniref:Uncharacterized protein n=1 Tax=Caerostris extrusa TaxID=172846 RepID=A0AAV4TGT3_CAEEX|nr:hypothetical protein CEXT_475371 [Caerostris extrusa]